MSKATEVTRQQVLDVQVPAPSGRHYPIPYGLAIDETLSLMTECGSYHLKGEDHILYSEGQQWLGTFRFGIEGNDEYGLTLGLFGSYNKTKALRILIGNVVWVCSNGCWSAEFSATRRNTRYGTRDAKTILSRVLGNLSDVRDTQDKRIAAYKESTLTATQTDALMWRAVERKAIPMALAPRVKDEFLKPSHECFDNRSVWSFQNAFTEIYKTLPPSTLHSRSTALNGLLDAHVGLAS